MTWVVWLLAGADGQGWHLRFMEQSAVKTAVGSH